VDTISEELLRLLATDAIAPGEFLVEAIGERLLLWRVSEGERPDAAFDPAPDWSELPA
jgi:hypothetical protein